MQYKSHFSHDLEVGQRGEDFVGRTLVGKIEVKTDFKAFKSGNVFVEYQSNGRKSGISTSGSDWWAFVISNEQIIFVKTEQLKKMCRRYLKTKRDVNGGDNNSSKGILLPLTELTTVF